jgi:hypothetical protein
MDICLRRFSRRMETGKNRAILLSIGFGEKLDRTRFHGLHRHRNPSPVRVVDRVRSRLGSRTSRTRQVGTRASAETPSPSRTWMALPNVANTCGNDLGVGGGAPEIGVVINARIPVASELSDQTHARKDGVSRGVDGRRERFGRNPHGSSSTVMPTPTGHNSNIIQHLHDLPVTGLNASDQSAIGAGTISTRAH